MNKKRVDSTYFATEIKITERNKQFVMSESTKVTKSESEKARSFMSARRKLSRGVNVDILFIIFKLLMISVPSKIILH